MQHQRIFQTANRVSEFPVTAHELGSIIAELSLAFQGQETTNEFLVDYLCACRPHVTKSERTALEKAVALRLAEAENAGRITRTADGGYTPSPAQLARTARIQQRAEEMATACSRAALLKELQECAAAYADGGL